MNSYAALPTFDESALDQLHELQVAGAPSFVGGLISDYLIQAKELGSLIQSLQSAGDTSGLGKAAHKLKSGSAVLGLAKLAAICQEIEDGTRHGKETAEHVAALQEAMNAAISTFTSYLTKLNK
jgi:HPt (histidine-containing phosphotransfer) domain-containing protein